MQGAPLTRVVFGGYYIKVIRMSCVAHPLAGFYSILL